MDVYPPPMPPGQQLRQRRRALDLRQQDVAEKAGCAVSLVCMTEKGYEPSEAMRGAMAAAVGASFGSFW